jgi:hypothetical protein
VQGAGAVTDGGEVSGTVAEAAVALLHDERGGVSVRPGDVIEEHDQRAVTPHGDAALLEVVSDVLEERVVEALAYRVLVGQKHAEAVVDVVEVDL